MDNLFSDQWMQALQAKWNASPAIVEALGKAGFSSSIGYGFKYSETPEAMIVVDNGQVTFAGKYDGRQLDWDLRANPEDWAKWIREGFGLVKLGPAVATGALKFARGDYRRMIREPALSHPFLEHFKLMSEIGESA